MLYDFSKKIKEFRLKHNLLQRQVTSAINIAEYGKYKSKKV